jgi:hypothetical protein
MVKMSKFQVFAGLWYPANKICIPLVLITCFARCKMQNLQDNENVKVVKSTVRYCNVSLNAQELISTCATKKLHEQ